MEVIKDYKREDIEKILQGLKGKNFEDRFNFLFKKFKGRKYIENPLSDFSKGEKLVFYLKKFDCFTLIETFVAFILNSPVTESDVIKNLISIRYSSEKISYKTRNHYLTQWEKNNRAFLKDLTPSIDGNFMVIKRLNFLKEIPQSEEFIHVISYKNFLKSLRDLKNGDFLLFLSEDNNRLDYFHTGILKKGMGKNFIFHASKKYGEVLEEEIEAFFKRTFYPPLSILRLKDGSFKK